MAEDVGLPPGFVIDEQQADLPDGFVLEGDMPTNLMQTVPDYGVAPEQGGQGVVRTTEEMYRQAVLGEGRMDFPDMPDIAEAGQALIQTTGDITADERFRSGLLAASDPNQVVDIATQNLPGSTVRQDSQGNPIIDWNGQSYYAWKPGFRMQDARRLVGQGLAYGGAAKLSHAMSAGSSLVNRVLASFGMMGGTSIGLDLAAGAKGSEQGVSVPRAVLAGGIGGVAEMFTPLAQGLARTVTRTPPIPDESIAAQGAKPTEELRDALTQQARDAATPEQAVRVAESQSLPVPVRETRGTATMDPATQMFEDQASKGVFGQQASDMMRGVRAEQQEQLRKNVPAIQDRLSGGSVLPEEGMGGAIAQSELQAAHANTKRAVDAAYDAARANPAAVAGEMVDRFAGQIADVAGDFPRFVEAASAKLGDLRSLASNQAVSVDDLFKWRSEVSKLYRSAPDQQAAKGLKSLLEGFDNNVQGLVDDALMAGDEQAARLWGRAVRLRRGEGSRFGSRGRNPLAADLLEREPSGTSTRLKVAPEAATNYIFGKANLGFLSKPELARDMMVLRQRLGRDSDGWKALREEAFLRFARQAEGGMDGNVRQFSGAKFAKAWDDARRKNAPLLNVLFTEGERSLISQFARTAARITNEVRGGSNRSNTSAGLANIGVRVMNALTMGPNGQALLSRIFPPLYDALQSGKLARSVGGLPKREPINPALPRAAGGMAGAQAGNELQSSRHQ